MNSIENFARSWQRAAGFHEAAPQEPSFVFAGDGEQYRRQDIETGAGAGSSLLRAHLDTEDPVEAALDDDYDAEDDEESTMRSNRANSLQRSFTAASGRGSWRGSFSSSPRGNQSIFGSAAQVDTPLGASYGSSYGTNYGTLRPNLNEPSMTHAGQIWIDQQKQEAKQAPERDPILIKQVVDEDGNKKLVVAGQSTLPQTVFNSINVLIGIGLLALPLGIRYAGWICGMSFLTLAAVVTAYTARIIAKCMDSDDSLITFADLAYVSYGQKARVATSILFTLELLAACVALIVLFGDTLHLLFPSVGVIEFKILCGLLLIPLNFAPLRLLSFTSILGIFSCLSIVLILFLDGFIKPHSPGSLLEPAATYLFPANWKTIPLAFGLLMSPWGGHGVFPNIYKDMRHPFRYKSALKQTFIFTYILDAATATAGLLMFGDSVKDEVTANIIGNSGYPQTLSVLICIFIAIIPITKVPLNARPIISTIEVLLGLNTNPPSLAPTSSLNGLTSSFRGILKILVRIITLIIFVLIAIVFPAFDSIMAFMGSSLCFTICVILPLLFYLKIFRNELEMRERVLAWVLICLGSVMAVVGTVWAFLPKEMIGAV